MDERHARYCANCGSRLADVTDVIDQEYDVIDSEYEVIPRARGVEPEKTAESHGSRAKLNRLDVVLAAFIVLMAIVIIIIWRNFVPFS